MAEITDPNDPNALIAKQFAAQRQNLLYQNKAAKDEASMAVSRNQAISGLGGGTALKLKQNAERDINDQYNQASNQLAAQEAGTKAQESQFSRQYDLQNRQFEESKNQFAKQMDFQTKEFTENQKTNLINTYLALDKAGFLVNTSDFGNRIGVGPLTWAGG